jgi:nitrogen fixation NifU-like protein
MQDWKNLYETQPRNSVYTPRARDHFLHPRNVGLVEDPDGVGRYGDPTCGDFLEVTIRVEGDTLADVRFRVHGCPGAISTSSAMTVLVKGKSIRHALNLTDDDVVDYLGGLPENKKHCSLLGVQALRAAVADAVLMQSLIDHGVVPDKKTYLEMRESQGGVNPMDHSCDGSCGFDATGTPS